MKFKILVSSALLILIGCNAREGPVVAIQSATTDASGNESILLTGDSLNVQLVFDQVVLVEDVPTFELNVGPQATGQLTYVSGSGTKELIFATNIESKFYTAKLKLKSSSFTGGKLFADRKNISSLEMTKLVEALSLIRINPALLSNMALGAYHTCALSSAGKVKCWGSNSHGQLGLGDTNDRGDTASEMGGSLPVIDLGSGRTAISVKAGVRHTCALLDNGSVKCWGDNTHGQLGLENSLTRGDAVGEMGDDLPSVDLGTGRTAVSIDAGASHNCALLDNGSVKCWGYNGSSGNEGLLGIADPTSNKRGDGAGEMGDNLPSVPLGTGRSAIAIASGSNHTCAILDNRDLKCWGDNRQGQLGYGDVQIRGDTLSDMGDSLPAVNLGTSRSALLVSTNKNDGAINHSTCAVLDDNSLKCWGGNSSGQLGLGDTSNRGDGPNEMGQSLPVIDLGANLTIMSIGSGDTRHCAVLSDGEVKCWGLNAVSYSPTLGLLGIGDSSTNYNRGDSAGEMGSSLPSVSLGSGSSADAVVGGVFHTCAVLDNGNIKCWGFNLYGQLGQGDQNVRGSSSSEMGDNLPAINLGSDFILYGYE